MFVLRISHYFDSCSVNAPNDHEFQQKIRVPAT
jgi:hypothetical protein